MTRKTLIAAAVVAALASPLVAADQSVEKATRYRATAPEVVSHVVAEPVNLELDSLANFDPFSAFIWNESAEQIDELGGKCCFHWNEGAEQVEELGEGAFYWNDNAGQVEELGEGAFHWNDSAEQIEELGGKDRFIWAQSAEQVEELGPKKKMAIKHN